MNKELIEIRAIDILKLKELKQELKKEAKYNQWLIQEFIDTVETDKLDRITIMHNDSCIQLKKLNKRIVLLTRFLQEGY